MYWFQKEREKMGDNIKVVYSYSDASDNSKLAYELLHSLHTIRKFFEQSDIIVFYTPPYVNEDMATRISKYATIERRPRFPIPYYPDFPAYIDKFWLTEVDSERLIFLDNDTEVWQDPRKFFEREFDILNRIDNPYDKERWNLIAMHEKLKDYTYKAWDVVFFNNFTHRKIYDNLVKYANLFESEHPYCLSFKNNRFYEPDLWNLSTRSFKFSHLDVGTDYCWCDGCRHDRWLQIPILHGSARRHFGTTKCSMKYWNINGELKHTIEHSFNMKHCFERFHMALITLLEDDFSDFKITWLLQNDILEIKLKNAEIDENYIEKALSAFGTFPFPFVKDIVVNYI